MAEHYFSSKPSSEAKRKIISATLRDKEFKFVTSSGVFAFGKLDNGTKLMINTVKLKKADTVMDLGCGYGTVGISLASEVARVLMSDVNERAVDLAIDNLRLNKVTNARAVVSDGFEQISQKFSLILLNPPTHAGRKIVNRLVEESCQHLKKNGRFYFVCKTKLGAKSYGAFIEEVFGNLELVKRGSGYRVFRAVKD